MCSRMMSQIGHRSPNHDQGGDQHSHAQQIGNQPFNPIVIQWLHGYQNPPVNPLNIISTPSSTITTLNTRRNRLVWVLTSTRVPIKDPINTPIITGIANEGST